MNRRGFFKTAAGAAAAAVTAPIASLVPAEVIEFAAIDFDAPRPRMLWAIDENGVNHIAYCRADGPIHYVKSDDGGLTWKKA